MARDPAVPSGLKLKVLGALGYFILPLDFIPDAILGLGFTDDLAALTWALFKIKKFITPDIETRARERLREWFGPEEGEEFRKERGYRGISPNSLYSFYSSYSFYFT